MPGRKTSRFTKDQNALLQGEVMIMLAESEEALTIEQIQQKSILLTGLSSQKMARILSRLIEMGNVTKAKSKSQGKMVYKSLAVMEKQGYHIEELADDNVYVQFW